MFDSLRVGSSNPYMIFESSSAQQFLLQEFDRRVRNNSRYSMRAYAKFLGVSAGSLSEILRKERPLSLKAATRMAERLGLSREETKQLCKLVEHQKRTDLDSPLLKADSEAADKRILSEDSFNLVSEWFHFAILNLMDVDGFVWRASYISKRLGISLAQSQMSMNLLLRIGLVENKKSWT
ncbi:MAG: TIGR02147 family protein, partial [Proteobacteria bacterium]